MEICQRIVLSDSDVWKVVVRGEASTRRSRCIYVTEQSRYLLARMVRKLAGKPSSLPQSPLAFTDCLRQRPGPSYPHPLAHQHRSLSMPRS